MNTNHGSLASIPLFAGLPEKTLERLEKLLVRKQFPPGSEIVHEGERGVSFFVVVEGVVEVLKGPERQPVARLTAGDYFGEMALFDHQLRAASIRALQPTQCLVLTQWDFLAEVRANPDLAVGLLASLARRARDPLHALYDRLLTAPADAVP